MTSEEIRLLVHGMYQDARLADTTEEAQFATAQHQAKATYEVAAQLAELNEQLRNRVTPL